MISQLDLDGSGIERIDITIRQMTDIERADRGIVSPEGWYVFYNLHRTDHADGPVAGGVMRLDAADAGLFGVLVNMVRTRPQLVRDNTNPPQP